MSTEPVSNIFLGKSHERSGVDLSDGNPAAIGYIDKAAVDGSVKIVLSP